MRALNLLFFASTFAHCWLGQWAFEGEYPVTLRRPSSYQDDGTLPNYSAIRRKPLDKSKLKFIEIGGLFAMNGSSGWLGGQGCLPAAIMALDDVNNNEDLLPGYYLNLTWSNSQCDPGLGAAVLYDLIYTPPNKTLILGGCSMVCSTVAETAKMYNLVVVGYGSSSPALSDRVRFPTFFRTHPSATIHNPTRVKLFEKFKWSRVAIILEAEEVFVTTGTDLEMKCKEADIEIISRVSFLDDPTEAVKSLVRQDARIIVAMAYGSAARKIMCEAYKNGLYGKQYVWLLIGWYEANWFHPVPGLNCTMEEMLKVVEKHITTEALMLNQGQQLTIAGMTAQDWLKGYKTELNSSKYREWIHDGKPQEGYQEAPLAYDAIWAIAFALNKSIERLSKEGKSLHDFNYENSEITEIIKSELQKVQFLGVSGSVAFNDIGDRISWTLIEQMIDGEYKTLGFYDTITDNLTWYNKEEWFVSGKVPKDRTEIKPTLVTVNRTLYVSLSTVSIIGMVIAILLLAFNYKFRNNRYIQMSNPSSNNLMLVGSVLCLISVLLFGLDGQDVGIEYFEVICNSRAFFLSVGFSLFFGAMFAKTWICHVLHTQNKRKISNNQVYLIISIFCLLDVTLLIIWYIKDPMSRRMEYFPLENPELLDDDVKYQPLLEHCEAGMVWYGIFYGYKGLVLLFGLFLSYETRSVKMKQLNDSRLVGMSIYNVVILCLITGPVSLVIDNQVNSHFAFISLTIIFCCFLSMALIFIPKIVEIVRHRQNQGSGLNGTFHETMSSKEEEERFIRLTSENEELKMKIAEKERQIDDVKKKIEQMTKEQLERRRAEERAEKIAQPKTTTKKAVRIQEPDDLCDNGKAHALSEMHMDATSDSGFVSTKTKASEAEFSESYL